MSAVQLSISGQEDATNPTKTIITPSINTSIKFDSMTNDVPITCKEIIAASNNKQLTPFLSTYKLNELQSNISQFLASLTSITPSTLTISSSASDYIAVKNYLDTVANEQIPVLTNVYNCLNETSAVNSSEYKSAIDNYDTSRSRYEDITTDHPRVSYYEGWFPIVRPLKVISLFLLFGFAILLIILSILIFLQMKGIEIKLEIPATQAYGYNPAYTNIMGFGAITGFIFIVIALWRGWF